MTEAAPWLVLGGGATAVACIGAVLVVILRAVRHARHVTPPGAARSALETALTDATADEEAVMPLLLAAAIETSGATAAAVTWLSDDGRRRSFSANLDPVTARNIVRELVEAGTIGLADRRGDDPERSAVRDGKLIVSLPRRSGALGVYWTEGAPDDVTRIEPELEQLLAATFHARTEPGDGAERVEQRLPTQGTALAQPSLRVAKFHETVDLAPILRAIAHSARADCGADGAAAAVHDSRDEPGIAETLELADYERAWVEPILGAVTVVPSITRYVGAQAIPEDEAYEAIATTVVVPLREPDGDPIGNLVAIWRRDIGDEADARLNELETLADDARMALGNAIRFRRLQAIAVRDRGSGAFDERYFFGALGDACRLAHENSEPLLLLAATAADVTSATGHVDLSALERSLAAAVQRVANIVADRGIACRINLGTLAAIVPGTTAAAERELVASVRAALREPQSEAPTTSWRLATVELEPSDDADAIWQRALDALGKPLETRRLAEARTG